MEFVFELFSDWEMKEYCIAMQYIDDFLLRHAI